MVGRRESHSLRGAIDRPALLTIRDVLNDEEPLATAELDDYLDPSKVAATFETGLCGANSCRIDIQWTTQDDYKFHYTDPKGVNLRWGKHRHGGDYVNVNGPEHYVSFDPPASHDERECTCYQFGIGFSSIARTVSPRHSRVRRFPR